MRSNLVECKHSPCPRDRTGDSYASSLRRVFFFTFSASAREATPSVERMTRTESAGGAACARRQSPGDAAPVRVRPFRTYRRRSKTARSLFLTRDERAGGKAGEGSEAGDEEEEVIVVASCDAVIHVDVFVFDTDGLKQGSRSNAPGSSGLRFGYAPTVKDKPRDINTRRDRMSPVLAELGV
ncbi:hypothetical protein EVAR_61443_1 [Eumeta japonica]|uniref:Uncharacterized protein n=1 Tax=Eumeta variegata TaxID=151549 RepID=A0A4C1Z3N6_EUMVA|nr:hypothetical protein EVAR_61443_1 [Eumeta japonica]